MQKKNTSLWNLLLAVCMLPLSTLAQQKKMLTADDYDLWNQPSKILHGQISKNSQWAYYQIRNAEGDSAYVRNIKTGMQYGFQAAASGFNYARLGTKGDWNFNSNSKWFAIKNKDSVAVLDLKKSKIRMIPGTDFEFVYQSERIIVVQKGISKFSLILQDLVTGKSQPFDSIKAYSFNQDVSRVALYTDSAGIGKLKIVELSGKIHTHYPAKESSGSYGNFIWNKSGDALAFVELSAPETGMSASDQLYACHFLKDRMAVKSITPASQIPQIERKKGRVLDLSFSDDGCQLFFNILSDVQTAVEASSQLKNKNQPVEIWGASALSLPIKNRSLKASFWYVWNSDNRIENMTTEDFPFSIVSGDFENIMVYNNQDYLPQHLYVHSFTDIFLKERKTGRVKLLVPKVKDQPWEFICSPGGKYISYFKQNHWWVYDFEKETHTCVTENMNIDWSNDLRGSTGTLPPYENTGWLANDAAVILHDEFDIWLISPDGKSRKRITNGKEENITFRLEARRSTGPGGGNQWFRAASYNGDEGLFITSVDYDNHENGWWFWTPSGGLKNLVSKQRKLNLLSKPEPGKPLLFTEEDFDLAPRLVLRHPSGKEEILHQTHPQLKDYYWGKSKIIRYKTTDGMDLTGALFFPANYDSTQKYPMVVEIYEKRSKEVHYFVNPSVSASKSNGIINPTDYTLDGYFVLLPDISYRLNEPGISATRCVTAAVQRSLDLYSIDKDKIGLTGYSFGGYETAFISTQTNMFATAVVGAGITDLPDFYLGYSDFGTNLTRVEQDQFRMNVPFYTEAFNRNSPMHNIDKINAPLLIYTGKDDSNVDWTQSRRFFTALWRLGKKSTLLAYPGENHAIRREENKLDLGIRLKDWFDCYLKKEKPAQWIKDYMGVAD